MTFLNVQNAMHPQSGSRCSSRRDPVKVYTSREQRVITHTTHPTSSIETRPVRHAIPSFSHFSIIEHSLTKPGHHQLIVTVLSWKYGGQSTSAFFK